MAVTRRSLTEVARLQAEVGQIIDTAVQANAQAWLDAWVRLSPAWQAAVAAAIDTAARTGRWPSSWQLARIPEVAAAQHATTSTVTTVGAGILLTAGTAAVAVAAASLAAQPLILTAQLPAPLVGVKRAEWSRRLPAGASSAARQARTAMNTRTQALAGDVGSATAAVVVRNPGTASPQPSSLLARISTVFDQARHRAATAIRTELVDATRAASALAQDALSEYVADWLWICACDPSSCPGCWALHGTAHPVTETGPLGHPNCRCQRLTRIKPWSKLGITAAEPDDVALDGEAKFRRLSRADQLAVMGAERLRLLTDDEIAWSDLSMRRPAKGWRDSYTARPLNDLRRIAGRRT